MALFRRTRAGDPALPKEDRGDGSLDDYAYDLIPRNHRIVMRLENSTPYQDELRRLSPDAGDGTTTATPARSQKDDAADAPIPVRLFLGRSVSGVVGNVPRGLEAVYDEAVRRLESRSEPPRIPARIVSTRHGLRVELLMGLTR